MENQAQASPSTMGPVPYVVGVGASAGGLEALERFFHQVPRESGLAFVLVQHLSPDFKSLMDELLARHTVLPICSVTDGMVVEPNHVYLIPPNKEMIISGGKLLLSERDRAQDLALPIDLFFRSLAQDCGNRSVAIVLSGGGSDGSRGIEDVHTAGGLVVVQDPETAQFDSMPKNAIDSGVADLVLAPQEMSAAIIDYIRGLGAPTRRSLGRTDGQEGLDQVYAMLEEEYGIDFTHYKPNTVTRRIARRLKLARTENIDEYVARLRAEREELDALYRDLLIGVTRFFRDETPFDMLERRLLPELLQRGRKDTEFRVWVAGCATGEEAYSIAMLLHELSPRFGGRPFKIFATDVHRGSLEVATRGLYDEDAVSNVSPERLGRYFTRQGKSYQVVPELRQSVVFAPHNVVRDAPFTRVDLVTCRNLLIYLQPPAQQKVLGLFHFALNRSGILVLGPSETAGLLGSDFEPIDAQWRIYRKQGDLRPLHVNRSLPRPVASVCGTAALHAHPPYSISQLLSTYDALLEERMGPSLLLSDRGELVHVFGGASRFLKARNEGRQGLDALEAVDGELKMVLVAGLARARREHASIVYNGARLVGEDSLYRIVLRPLPDKAGAVHHILVSFEQMEARPREAEQSATEIDAREVPREQLTALELELSQTKESLHAAIEALESSNEELQATNEELLASNEELQSTNEELQSVNEELYTVNAEYQRKIAELTELTNDMENLLASTDVGTIFLDRELRIRRFTPRIEEVFNVLAQDIGRPIEAFTHSIQHPGLVEDLKSVLASGNPVEREVVDRCGKAFYLRVLPYRATGSTEGVVLTLIDVTGLRQAEDALFHERYLLNSLLASVPNPIYFRDVEGRLVRLNEPMARLLGVSDPAEVVGKKLSELSPSETLSAFEREDTAVLTTAQPQKYRLERVVTGDGTEQWHWVTRLPLLDRFERIVGTFGVFHDVTEQKMAEERIQDGVRRRDHFLAMLSHELRNPLNAIVTASSLLRTRNKPERRGKALNIIERQTKQMTRLLDDLLEVGRIAQNKIELKKQVVDLRAIAREAADAARHLMTERSLEFGVEIDSTPLYVEGDPARLLQVQMNLLHNAAKYTPAGGNVQLEARADDGQAVVRVRDTGAGISPDMLERVFDLFVQSHATLDRAEGGMGVGLTLVRTLVSMHGGKVLARSEGDGHGSEFVVRLPLSATAPIADSSEPRGEPLRSVGGSRVVLIEDNDDIREALCELLDAAGFDCHSAADGPSGWTLINEFHPDVAIIDIGLPQVTGLDLARQIRADPRHANLYLVALTGYGQPSDRANALDAGFDEHVVKPIDSDTLIRLLDRARSRNEQTMN